MSLKNLSVLVKKKNKWKMYAITPVNLIKKNVRELLMWKSSVLII